jgi:hypothetical protein
MVPLLMLMVTIKTFYPAFSLRQDDTSICQRTGAVAGGSILASTPSADGRQPNIHVSFVPL